MNDLRFALQPCSGGRVARKRAQAQLATTPNPAADTAATTPISKL